MYGNQYLPYQSYQPQQLIRVSGIDGARAYQMPPNSTAALFDSNEDVMYIRTTDGAGFPTIRTFVFTEQMPQAVQQGDYVTRKEFEELKEMLTNGQQSVRRQAKQSAE